MFSLLLKGLNYIFAYEFRKCLQAFISSLCGTLLYSDLTSSVTKNAFLHKEHFATCVKCLQYL